MTDPTRSRGRPQFKATPSVRKAVEQMVACGDSKQTIARAVGCSVPTLDLHFEEELKTGYAKKRREVLQWMYAGAKKGNATLIKRLEEMTRLQGAAADFDKDAETTEPAAKPRGPKMGKKDVQREEALNAGVNSEWGDDLAPLAGSKLN